MREESIVAEDEQTITFELNQSYAPFLPIMVLVFVVDKATIMDNVEDGEYGDRADYGQAYINNNDAGSGAYQLKDFSREFNHF